MATTSKLIASNGLYGYKEYSHSAARHIYAGADSKSTRYNYRSRLTFQPLTTIAGVNWARVAIRKMELYLRRDDGGDTQITVGCSASGAWGAVLAATESATIEAADGWYKIDITSLGVFALEYKANWFIHIAGKTPSVRFVGTAREYKPYIMVTWEYVAATIGGNKNVAILGKDQVKFTIKPEVAAETHTLKYEIGDLTGTIAVKKGNTISWTPPRSLASEMTDSDYGTVKIHMTAYNSDGKIQRTELYYQAVSVPDDICPKIVSTGAKIEKGLSGYGMKGRSYISFSPKINMEDTYGASIVDAVATINDSVKIRWTEFSKSTASEIEFAYAKTGIISSVGDIVTKITITDSRGRTVSLDDVFTFFNYSVPKIQSFSVERYEPIYDKNEEIVGYAASDVGENVWVNMNIRVSSIAPEGKELNKLKWKIEAVNTKTGASEIKEGSGNQTLSKSDDKTMFTGDVSGDSAYAYTLTVLDSAGGQAMEYSFVAEAHSAFSISPDKYGFAVGMLAGGTAENPMFEVSSR